MTESGVSSGETGPRTDTPLLATVAVRTEATTDDVVRVLPQELADQIAAGEVVERPASVVKELVENAIDARATRIGVHLREGGRAQIEVIDNGIGMTDGDLGRAVLAHATSKIRSSQDLGAVATLGFRGEALPSIAAVARLEIVTRPESRVATLASSAYAFDNESGRVRETTHGHFLTDPHGTRVCVSGLFAQTPARFKFLKSPSAEVAQVRDWLERLAIAHPEIGFSLTSDGRELMALEPERRDLRIRRVLSDGDLELPWVESVQEYGVARIELHWLTGLSFGQMRKVVIVVNGRVVKDRLLIPALLSAFKQHLLPGQHPALVLYVWLPYDRVDVNVHPSKTEVRFVESSAMFAAVRSAAEGLLAQHAHARMIGSGATQTPRVETQLVAPLVSGESSSLHPSTSLPTDPPANLAEGWVARAPEPMAAPSTSLASGAGSLLEGVIGDAEYTGVWFQTYLAWQNARELILIDQHAAHERIRFEELKRQALGGWIEAQALLIPEAIAIAPEQWPAIEARLALLSEMGFEVEVFGHSSVLVRSIPAAWEDAELKIRLKNVLERVSEAPPDARLRDLALDERWFERLASQACRSSVRAGDRLGPTQAMQLLRRLSQTEHPWNCPHGRLTVVRVPRARFEEWFQRRV